MCVRKRERKRGKDKSGDGQEVAESEMLDSFKL